MATLLANGIANPTTTVAADPFTDTHDTSQLRPSHRYSAHLDPALLSPSSTSSPFQVKRSLEAYLSENERRLQDAQNLGNALLKQQSELTDRLREVEEQQDEAQLSPELTRRLVELEKEQDDVGREIARALLGPKARVVSGEDKVAPDTPALLSNQVNGSPSKAAAPSRKQRNQSTDRVGDIQFAADISTSLLAQVRQMQTMLAERDEALRNLTADKSRLESDTQAYVSRIRAFDDSEQRYKDESWRLESHNHELRTTAQEASERESKLKATAAAATTDIARLRTELDEARLAHQQVSEDHARTKKAHDLEMHSMQKESDTLVSERDDLQTKHDELLAQNQELTQGLSTRFRGRSSDDDNEVNGFDRDMENGAKTPEHSPPPSPVKATPRHGGLESETLKSSLHHAHRMIQNLKSSIHRDKVEKAELRRLLQETRDENESYRVGGIAGSGTKRNKSKVDLSRKSTKVEMLGGARAARTDIDYDDPDWEEHNASTEAPASSRNFSIPGAFDARRALGDSDAYHTATETEGAFETADEKHGNESEDFQTGNESLGGDSTDELTEREDNPGKRHTSLALKPAGDRRSYLSTASTSAGEEEDDLRTPVQTVPQKFRLKHGRASLRRFSPALRDSNPGTPQNATAQDSPATINSERSPPAAEQTLFAELGEFDDASSDRYNTPGRSSIASQKSTPAGAFSARRSLRDATPTPIVKPSTTDAGTMTDHFETSSERPQALAIPSSSEDPSVNNVADPVASPSVTSTNTEPSAHTGLLSYLAPALAYSGILAQNTHPVTPPRAAFKPATPAPATQVQPQPALSHSSVLAQHIPPVAPQITPVEPAAKVEPISQPPLPRTPSKTRDLAAIDTSSPVARRSNSAHRAATLASHPPLPADHLTNIARASTSGLPPAGPGRETNNSSHVSTIMGPPIAPASAYRRPRTPADASIRSTVRESATPRQHQRNSTRDRSMISPGSVSRRSSVSSFVSELDERFNIRAADPTAAAPPGLPTSSSTDPRMIQAITQTMIGEYLFKYTRKPGSTDMSSTRHRRYFWVHPYTKLLYWSEKDPQSAGRNQLRTKSVLIQSVRAVTDDNPMPPGLHGKSLEIVSLGRKVKVTASTSQRHEVWFNALSYLLLRGDAGISTHNQPLSTMAHYANVEHSSSGITDADVDEFRVGGYGGPDRDSRSRSLLRPPSLSSYNSRGTSANRSTVRMSTTIYDASAASDAGNDAISMTGARAEPPRSEGLENVRSCCDGMYLLLLFSSSRSLLQTSLFFATSF